MNKYFGFVTFYKEEDIKEGNVLNKEVIIYPNLEDSLRFFTIEDEVVIASVSTTKYESLPDSDYYGYFNMKKASEIKIEKIYSYEEIIEIMTSKTKKEEKVDRFLQRFKIEEQDREKFIELSPLVKNSLELFQGQKEKTMVKKYGQNSNKGC